MLNKGYNPYLNLKTSYVEVQPNHGKATAEYDSI